MRKAGVEKLSIHFRNKLFAVLVIGGVLFAGSSILAPRKALASCCCEVCPCACACATIAHTAITRPHISLEFKLHERWFVKDFFPYILRVMQMMTEQLTVTAMQQVEIIGVFLDAKHQLETQTLLQQLQAKAYEDYRPSEMMCTVGTNFRALSASERNADYVSRVLGENAISRQLLNGDRSVNRGNQADIIDRMELFKTTYCDIEDNAEGMEYLCGTSGGPAERVNKDVNYTRLVDDSITLDIDFSDDNDTADEQDIISLQNNLFTHTLFSTIQPTYLDRHENQELYLDARSIIAKRGVLLNAYNHQVGMRAHGSGGNDAFLRAVMKDIGADNNEIARIGKDNPSYYAQLRTLVKLLQNPKFFAKLYDTPANVERMGVALKALEFQLDYQMLQSNWRLEMILAVDAELALLTAQEDVENELGKVRGNKKTD